MDKSGIEVLFNTAPTDIKKLQKNINEKKPYDEDDIFGALDEPDIFSKNPGLPPPDLDFDFNKRTANNGGDEREKEIRNLFSKIDNLHSETPEDPIFSKSQNNDDNFSSKYNRDSGINIGAPDWQPNLSSSRNRPSDREESDSFAWKDPKLRSSTIDEYKTQLVGNVMRTVNQENVFDFSNENEEDKKVMMLEEIDILVEVLKSEDIDISRIKLPDISSSLKEINCTRDRLHLMNNRTRSRIFAEEIIMVGTYLTEKFLDGKHEYFGYRPDVTGWTNTVNIKLRRMRYDTSNLVNKVVSHHQLGPMTRILMELVPSLILYSRSRKNNNKDTLSNVGPQNRVEDLNRAHERIRAIDNLKTET